MGAFERQLSVSCYRGGQVGSGLPLRSAEKTVLACVLTMDGVGLG